MEFSIAYRIQGIKVAGCLPSVRCLALFVYRDVIDLQDYNREVNWIVVRIAQQSGVAMGGYLFLLEHLL